MSRDRSIARKTLGGHSVRRPFQAFANWGEKAKKLRKRCDPLNKTKG